MIVSYVHAGRRFKVAEEGAKTEGAGKGEWRVGFKL